MSDNKTCKALRFVPVMDNLARTEDTKKLEDLLGLNEITEPHV